MPRVLGPYLFLPSLSSTYSLSLCVSSFPHFSHHQNDALLPPLTKTRRRVGPSSPAAQTPVLGSNGTRADCHNFSTSKQRSSTVFSGQSVYQRVHLNFLFNTVLCFSNKSGQKVGMHSRATEALSLYPSQMGPNLEITSPNS